MKFHPLNLEVGDVKGCMSFFRMGAWLEDDILIELTDLDVADRVIKMDQIIVQNKVKETFHKYC